MAEDVFKNIQVLKGIPVDEFMNTMGVFSVALGMSCEDCHAANDSKWENYALDTSVRKQTARKMVGMAVKKVEQYAQELRTKNEELLLALGAAREAK